MANCTLSLAIQIFNRPVISRGAQLIALGNHLAHPHPNPNTRRHSLWRVVSCPAWECALPWPGNLPDTRVILESFSATASQKEETTLTVGTADINQRITGDKLKRESGPRRCSSINCERERLSDSGSICIDDAKEMIEPNDKLPEMVAKSNQTVYCAKSERGGEANCQPIARQCQPLCKSLPTVIEREPSNEQVI